MVTLKLLDHDNLLHPKRKPVMEENLLSSNEIYFT